VKTGEVAFAPIHQTEEAISERALQECSLSLLPARTVLVAMYGQGKTRGQSAVLEVPATTNQACFAILPSEHLDADYLQFWLRHSYNDLRALSESRGGNQSNLSGAVLNAFEVPLVPMAQQLALVARVKAALVEAEALQTSIARRLAEIERLPARLLAQAFGDACP
jgi:type I restriction enzyme S subunit